MAIRVGELEGKRCVFAFFDDDFESCEENEASVVKVIFADGSNKFTLPDVLNQKENET